MIGRTALEDVEDGEERQSCSSPAPALNPSSSSSYSFSHLPDLLHISGPLLNQSPPPPESAYLGPLPGIVETFCGGGDVPHYSHHQQHDEGDNGVGGGALLLPPSPDQYLATFLPWSPPPPPAGDPGPPPAILQTLQPIRPELLPPYGGGRNDYLLHPPHSSHQEREPTPQRNLDLFILRKGIAARPPSPNFHIHVSVRDRYISNVRPTYFPAAD
jgi:hypothetical protein